ncbi:hypothetical protein EVAR_83878_1 [Eumeta japonica]|uniref:Uncharacterized protein n=1 Tax=Eumeta variegata TaxID=151549 RepID=A0A4C1URA4_EUMVA|nr:hypothetical protein EVAR_83878_1 [Eumeta japonica]
MTRWATLALACNLFKRRITSESYPELYFVRHNRNKSRSIELIRRQRALRPEEQQPPYVRANQRSRRAAVNSTPHPRTNRITYGRK